MINSDKKYSSLDKRIGDLATKKDLSDFRKDTDDKFEQLARMVSSGFEDVISRLDVRERVEKLEKKMDRVHKALNL